MDDKSYSLYFFSLLGAVVTNDKLYGSHPHCCGVVSFTTFSDVLVINLINKLLEKALDSKICLIKSKPFFQLNRKYGVYPIKPFNIIKSHLFIVKSTLDFISSLNDRLNGDLYRLICD